MSNVLLARNEKVSIERLVASQKLILEISRLLNAPNFTFENSIVHKCIKLVSEYYLGFNIYIYLRDSQLFSSSPLENNQEKIIEYLNSQLFNIQDFDFAWQKNNRIYASSKSENSLFGLICLELENVEIELHEFELNTLKIIAEIFNSFFSRSSQNLSNRELDLRFRSVLDNLNEGVSIGDLDDRMLYVNNRYCEIVGYSKDELIGKRAFRFLVPKEEQEKIKQGTSRRISGNTDSYTCPVITKEGKKIITLINACPYRNTNGDVLGSIASLTDITERVETEAENVRLQKLANRSQKMEAVGQLAAGFAHDLNNSLSAIVGHLNTAKFQSNLDDKALESIDAALNGCNSASEILKNVLTFASDSPVKTQVNDLKSIIDEAIELTKSIIPKNTSIKVSGFQQEYPVEVDKPLIIQAITNLIINSTQAMPSGGTISFNLSATDLENIGNLNRNASSGRYWVLTLSDTGSGISEEIQQRIFEPFFSTKGEKNSGLGLSMVYAIMQRHKGWIELDSTVGAGTAFSLYFAVPKNLTSQIEACSNSLEPGISGLVKLNIEKPTDKIVVVIDDEQVLAELACSFLERAGFKTKSFFDPEDCFEWFKHYHKDVGLILLDMKMPKYDGVATFEKLKNTDPNSQIVLISGYVDDHDVTKLLNRGAISFIQKPVKYSELVEWVKKTMKISNNSGSEAFLH
jgi:two-component system cell cycle sensor histidine kinase/response regulator CckA